MHVLRYPHYSTGPAVAVEEKTSIYGLQEFWIPWSPDSWHLRQEVYCGSDRLQGACAYVNLLIGKSWRAWAKEKRGSPGFHLRYGLVVRIAGSHPAGPGSIPGNGISVLTCSLTKNQRNTPHLKKAQQQAMQCPATPMQYAKLYRNIMKTQQRKCIMSWQRWDSNPRLRRDWCLKPAP